MTITKLTMTVWVTYLILHLLDYSKWFRNTTWRWIKADEVIEMLSDTDDEKPSGKQLKLSIDLELIIIGEMLTDVEINIARELLKSQFPTIHGLHLTLLQSKINENKGPVNNKLQVVHCKKKHTLDYCYNHWLWWRDCESLWFCVLYSWWLINNHYTKYVSRQDQSTTQDQGYPPSKANWWEDCGVFAVAFAT